MAEVIGLYLIFCLATAVTLCLAVVLPGIKHAKDLGIRNTFTENIKLTCFAYIVVSTLVAPLSFLVLVVPKFNIRYREATYRIIHEEN